VLLTGPEIVRLIERPKLASLVPRIEVDPFDEDLVGPNSIDVRLGSKLKVYRLGAHLDSRQKNTVDALHFPACGLRFLPGILYLGHTLERVGAWGLVPKLETKSSIARLGVSTHLSAGFGDDGFNAQWTLEITVVHPVMLYPGMRIAQIEFAMLHGERRPYTGKYQSSVGPVASRSWHESGAESDSRQSQRRAEGS
jgi:deoxycytidine triphosphate deaminase